MDFGAALLGLLTAGVVKVAVMVLAVRLVVRHAGIERGAGWRQILTKAPLPDGTEFRLLWWSLLLFCVSELTCGVELYILAQTHIVFTSMHGVASAAGMGLFGLAMVLYLDRRVLRFQQPRCVGRSVCRGCTLNDASRGCKVHGLVMLFAALLVLASLLPFFVPTTSIPALPERYVLPFDALNDWYSDAIIPWLTANFESYERTGVAFVLPEWLWILELRVVPSVALAAGLVAVALIARRQDEKGIRVMAFGAGVLAYAYMEILLYQGTGEALLGSLGHELIELWFLLAVGEWLRRLVLREGDDAALGKGTRGELPEVTLQAASSPDVEHGAVE